MNNKKKHNKTIPIRFSDNQRSSKNNSLTYFNPYAREENAYRHQPSENTYYNEGFSSDNHSEYKAVAAPEVRKKELKERNKLSKSQIRKIRKRQKVRFIIRMALIMFVTIIIVWIGMTIKDAFAYPKISYQVVNLGYIDNSKTFKGIVFRNEKIHYSPYNGKMKPIVGEGEKVKRDGAVCALIDNNAVIQTEQKVNKISTELYNAADKREQLSYYQDEVYQIDTAIKDTMNTFYEERLGDTADYIHSIRTQLDSSVNKRTHLYVQEQDQLNNPAAKELSVLDAKLDSLNSISKASESGIVSYYMDGQENKFNQQLLTSMTFDSFEEMEEKSSQNINNNGNITKGTPLYKVVTDDTWSILTYINLKQGEIFKEGQTYKLDFNIPDTISVNFTLKSKVLEEKNVRLVFETNEQVDRFLNVRNIVFSIGNKNEEGLKIPLQAIIEQNMIKIPAEYLLEQDGIKGVYRKKGEVSEFVKVIPQYEKDNSVYILQEIGRTGCIQINDILTDPKTGKNSKIDQIETSQGVYVINGKIAQFKSIEVSSRTNEYALVKYSPRNELKELDKIISNPKSIKSDQILQYMNIQNE